MKTLTIVNVNLQEGLILDGNQLIGGFSHHHKTVILLVGAAGKGDEERLPKDIKKYQILRGVSDSIGLNYWTNSGRLQMHDLKEKFSPSLKKEKV